MLGYKVRYENRGKSRRKAAAVIPGETVKAGTLQVRRKNGK